MLPPTTTKRNIWEVLLGMFSGPPGMTNDESCNDEKYRDESKVEIGRMT